MFYAVTAGFIAIDFITGLLKAFKKKEFSSSVMREGLFNKSGFILAIALGTLCDFGQNYLDLGFTVPLSGAICTYVIMTEIGSTIENLSVITPGLIPDKLKAFFIKIPK